jgi:hypothetical protein
MFQGYANYYWSDLGFDGPTVNTGETGYSVPDALTPDPANNGSIDTIGAPNIGYSILNSPAALDTCCNGSTPTDIGSLSIPNVDLAGVKAAYLSFDEGNTYTGGYTAADAELEYSVNGGPLTAVNPQPNYAAQQICSGCPGAPFGGGEVTVLFPVPLSDLTAGTNTVTFAVPNSDNGYPPIVTGVDLDTFTNPPSGL